MKLRTDLQGHLHLKNEHYETVREGKNDSEKLETLVEAVMWALDEIEAIKIRQGEV
jgi:hypothetical protein